MFRPKEKSIQVERICNIISSHYINVLAPYLQHDILHLERA
jgi:hypothetical protein